VETGKTMLTRLPSSLRERMTGLSSKSWFPQVPISLAMALLGLLHLIPVFEQALGLLLHIRTPGSVRGDLTGIDLLGISQLSIGVFLLAMSVGLWFRSQIAWLLSILAAVIGLINLYFEPDTPIPAWLFGYDFVLIAVMLTSRRHFDLSSMRLGTLIALSALVVLVGYSIVGIYHFGDQFSPEINTFPEAVYLSVVTMSTVGYGDFIPTAPGSRLFLTSVIVLSITVFSTAVGATLIPALIHKVEQITSGRYSRVTRNDHYIIVGYSTLSSNTYGELIRRGKQVTVILRREPTSTQFPDADVDFVIGDGSDLETLRKAGAEQAKAILALLDDDSENAFVVLAAKELHVKARTVVAVNDAKHLNRIRRVHPDMIIAPQVLGGELLTSMLTGERIDIADLMARMMGHSSSKSKSGNDD
jgi:voltage-gated potassium channel